MLVYREGYIMPRPRKFRRVCCLPEVDIYGPINAKIKNEEFIIMTVDEYEVIRLIDLEGFNQEECARQMNVARTTVQGIYIEARRKLAESLVNGKVLRIEGGNYELCSSFQKPCRGKGCPKNRCALTIMNNKN